MVQHTEQSQLFRSTIDGEHLVRILDEICFRRGKPMMIRTDKGSEFTGKAMLTWTHRNAMR